MSIKTNKRVCIACIAALLIVALAITLSLFLTAPIEAKAAEDNLHATYGGTHGMLDAAGSHRTDEEEVNYLINKYGAHANAIYKIDSSEKLYNFLNGNVVSSYQYGYLTKDMSIAYGNGADAAGQYDFKTSAITSGAIFNKVLDGNGYNVRIWSQTGEANYVDQADSYYTYGTITYRVAGLLCAVNQGTISNLTIDFNSNHSAVNAVIGWSYAFLVGWTKTGLENNDTSCIWTPKSNNSTIFGIVCGENGTNGLVENVRVNIKNNLTVIDRQSTSNGYLPYNMIYVGGLVGRALRDSVIDNCQVDISDNVVVCGTAEGDDGSSTVGNAVKGSLAVVGGILGKIDQTTSDSNGVHAAVLQYCAITGSGMVKALANKAQGDNSYYRAYSGGVVGACLNVSSNSGGISDGGTDSGSNLHVAEPGQIKSIISDWTGMSQNNYNNENTTILGQLFGSIGSNVQNCVVLYDLLSERANRGYTTQTIDSFRSGVLTSWVGAYPMSDDGEVIVRFNSDETSIYDIRMHAFSDNCGYTDESLLAVSMGNSRNTQYSMPNGTEGKFIWESYFGDSERLNLRIANPVVAEILTVSANVANVVNYTWSFGTMTTLTFGNTNGTTYTRGYEGMAKTLNKPSVTASLEGLTLKYTDADWVILRNGALTSSDMSGTALPGTYTMNVKADVPTYIDYGYYDATQRIAAWQPEVYQYVITKGVLSYGPGTSVLSDWNQSVKFELTMPSEDPTVVNFQFVRMVRNGTVVVFGEDDDPFVYSGNTANITIEDSTGKNGMKYSFIAYVWDGDNAIIVAETDSSQDYLVKIDREAPVIDDIEYYVLDSNDNRTRINERDLLTWRKERVLVKYTVTDDKSGIKFAQSNNGIKNTPISGGYEVEVTLTSSTAREISYTDNMNNNAVLSLQANVDYMTTDPRLALYNYTYASSENQYSTSGAIVRFKPTIGSSPWYLQYSWQKDANGNDIWESAYTTEQGEDGKDVEVLYQLKTNVTQSFTVDWNMGDSLLQIGADFKLRMVNDLYGIEELSKYDSDLGEYVVTDHGFVASFIINFKVARLYVDTSLKSVLVYGGDYNGESLADILERNDEEEIQKIFGKTYDGTLDYVNSEYRFEVRVDYEYGAVDDGAEFASETGVGVLYSAAYIKRPQDINATLPVKLAYRYADSGVAYVYAAFELGDLADKYDVYFVSHEGIDFTDEYSIIDGKDEWDVETTAMINPFTITVNVADYISDTYYYGETLPGKIQGVTAAGLTSGTFDIVIDSDLLQVCDANQDYWVNGTVYDEFKNIDITVESALVRIAPRPVYLDITFDGSEDIPTSVQAGTKRVFEAFYYDIDGVQRKATTQYFLLSNSGTGAHIEEVFDGISARGNYKIVISTGDNNYVTADQGPVDDNYTEGTYQFFFNIAQGTLKLACNDYVVQYKGNGIEYDAGVPDVDTNIFDARKQLTYKYYKYTESTKYEIAANGTVTITNKTDKNDYLGDGVKPSALGVYRVEIELAGNDSFLSNSYEGYMIITRAETTFYANNVSHAYTGEYFTLTLEEAMAEVIATNGAVPWNYTMDPSKVTIEYYDFGYKPVSSTPGGEGWYTEQDSYQFRVSYEGDELYAASSTTVTLNITPAEFQNIWFTGATGVYNGKNFVNEIAQNVPNSYKQDSSFRIIYEYNRWSYDSLEKIPAITAVGEHTINITVSMNNYATEEHSVTLVITEASFSGVAVVPYAGVYDGNRHTVSFNGLTEIDGAYYYTIKDDKGVAIKDESGKDIQIKVTVTGKGNGLTDGLYATDAGVYSLTVTLSADNFADLTLNTGSISIDKVQWPVDGTWTNMPSKIPSGVSVSDYYGTYTNGSTVTETTLVYTNSDNEIVTPDANGILPDGKYTVTLEVGNNHFIAKSWTLTVGRINSAELTPVSIVVLSVAVAVMVAAIVTAVVVVNKRKKADAIAE